MSFPDEMDDPDDSPWMKLIGGRQRTPPPPSVVEYRLTHSVGRARPRPRSDTQKIAPAPAEDTSSMTEELKVGQCYFKLDCIVKFTQECVKEGSRDRAAEVTIVKSYEIDTFDEIADR